MSFVGVKFGIPKPCPCKRNEKRTIHRQTHYPRAITHYPRSSVWAARLEPPARLLYPHIFVLCLLVILRTSLSQHLKLLEKQLEILLHQSDSAVTKQTVQCQWNAVTAAAVKQYWKAQCSQCPLCPPLLLRSQIRIRLPAAAHCRWAFQYCFTAAAVTAFHWHYVRLSTENEYVHTFPHIYQDYIITWTMYV